MPPLQNSQMTVEEQAEINSSIKRQSNLHWGNAIFQFDPDMPNETNGIGSLI
jgi:hypothetical protein